MKINIVVQIPIHSGSSSIVCNNCNMWEVQEEASWHSLKFSQVRTIGWNFYLVQLSVPGIVLPSLSDPIVQHQHYCHLHLGPSLHRLHILILGHVFVNHGQPQPQQFPPMACFREVCPCPGDHWQSDWATSSSSVTASKVANWPNIFLCHSENIFPAWPGHGQSFFV